MVLVLELVVVSDGNITIGCCCCLLLLELFAIQSCTHARDREREREKEPVGASRIERVSEKGKETHR